MAGANNTEGGNFPSMLKSAPSLLADYPRGAESFFLRLGLLARKTVKGKISAKLKSTANTTETHRKPRQPKANSYDLRPYSGITRTRGRFTRALDSIHMSCFTPERYDSCSDDLEFH